MKTEKRAFGDKGEAIATSFLERRGFEIIERNFLIRGGEMDIIALKKKCVHFVEVKTRSNTAFGTPLESISAAKIRRLFLTAETYLQRKEWHDRACCLDLITLFIPRIGAVKIEFFENIGEEIV